MMQLALFEDEGLSGSVPYRQLPPFRTQLLKWIGSKQRFAHEIAGYFPRHIGTYFEPFLGSGAVLATLTPQQAIASDILKPLIDIWVTLAEEPQRLKHWYSERWNHFMSGDRLRAYEQIKASYNANPNGVDLLFLSRSCYGGVVRFRQADGYMSTPIGVHQPITPEAFSRRVDLWHERTRNTRWSEPRLPDSRESQPPAFTRNAASNSTGGR